MEKPTTIINHIGLLINQVIHGQGDSDKHLMSLFSVALGMKAKHIVELGVRNGSTTLPLLLAAKLNGGHVVSVDINPTSFKPPKELEQYWTFVQSDALEFLRDQVTIRFTPYDLVYIDDWHSYEHVKKELEYIDRLVSPKSVVLLHDLMYGNYAPHYHSDLTLDKGQWANGGPYRAVAELDPQFWEFATLPYNNGLTLLRKKYSNLYFS